VFGGGANAGYVSGEKGVDKVPAMLTDGEFVMSAGAVQTWGLDTLEAMNAAGGGTNKPRVIRGTTFAQGGGSIGEIGDDRKRFIDIYNWFASQGINPGDPKTYGGKGRNTGGGFTGSERYSLMPGLRGETSQSDVYAIRAVNELIKVLKNKFPDSGSSGGGGRGGDGLNRGGDGGNVRPTGSSGGGGGGGGSTPSSGNKIIDRGINMAKNVLEKVKPTIESLPAMKDYGSLYLGSQFGGLGGSITEADLSRQTQDEYKKAFQRAKADLPNRIAKAESVVRQLQRDSANPNLTNEQKKDFNNKLANAKGELAKYKKGLVNVEYSDFEDKKGKLSPAAAAAQKTLGAVWASQTKDGGIKVEKEPYDFPLIEDPLGLMRWKMLSDKEKLAWLSKQNPTSAVRRKLDPRLGGSFGKWGKQDIAEAMYTLNPFATPVETDVKIGGTPRAKGVLDRITNAFDNPLLSMSRGLVMNLLKGKERNVVTGEAEKGSLMDKLFPKKAPSLPKPGQSSGAVKMYDKPQKNTGEAYKSRFARPKNAGVKPVAPPAKPKPRVTVIQKPKGNVRGGGSRGGSRIPPINAVNPNAKNSSAQVKGVTR